MRKRTAKLRLNRETLRALDANRLGDAAGGSDGSYVCQPSYDSMCDTVCLACPLRPPTIEN